MEKETLKKIFNFLEKKDNRNTPLRWKWSNGFPFTEDDLHVKGDLNLSDLEIEELPEGLKVEGDLFLQNSDIKSLPEGLEVGGDLDLTSSKVTSIPEGFKVGGSLITEHFPGDTKYHRHPYTDIYPLNKNFGLSCFNISIGYYNYHTRNEYVVVEDTNNGIKVGKLMIESLGYTKH